MEVQVNDANFKSEVLESKVPCLVDFWAEWCAPCRMVAPAVEEVANEYKDRLKVCKLNVDEAPNVASQYSIMSIPTLSVFKNGEIVEQIIGVVPKSDIVKVIQPHL
ncbi:MAG: thioredoxin [Candidatus Omnitrophota bacterium]|nr:MAG: thioredoxin [Candidatus Omnitrophota bacterium]